MPEVRQLREFVLELHNLTAVAPVLQTSREDKRFVASREVGNQLDERFNLAAMDWEDFEHLIRELFEEEFKKDGGEVKITQASRDGGVDAVAFDPDPIRGGKLSFKRRDIQIQSELPSFEICMEQL